MYFGPDLIQKKIEFSSLKNTEALDIAYGADDKFMFGAGVSIESVIINNKNRNFRFHLFTDHISRDNARRLSQICQNHRTAIHIYIVNTEIIKTLPSNNVWNHAIYFRLMIAEYFFGKASKVLYLDSDVFCDSDIGYLTDLDISGHTLAAVNDQDSQNIIESNEFFREQFANYGYFNSGVMLISTQDWNSKGITKRAMEILLDESSRCFLKYYDQDAINVAACGSVLFIEKKYNYMLDINNKYKSNQILSSDGTALYHFVGLTKPWHNWSTYYDECSPFAVAKASSPWKDESLISPQTKINYKYAAKHHRYNGNNIKSLQSYVQYKLMNYWPSVQ